MKGDAAMTKVDTDVFTENMAKFGYSYEELGSRLGVHPKMIRNYVQQGQMPNELYDLLEPLNKKRKYKPSIPNYVQIAEVLSHYD